MSRTRVQRELGAAMLALGLLLAILLGAAVWVSHDLESRTRRAFIRDAIPTKSAGQDLVLQLVNQATGVMGYVRSGQESNLATYRMGVRGVSTDLATLDRFAAGHPGLRAPLARIRTTVMDLQSFYRSQVALVRSGPAGRHRAVRRLNEGRRLFNRFRDAAAAFGGRVDAFVRQTDTQQHNRYETLVIILGLVGAAALAIAVALIVVVPRRTGQLVAERAARLADEREARETLSRVLALTPRFLDGRSPDEVTERICEAAVRAFGCSAASLWEIDGDELRLTARVPWAEVYTAGTRRPIAELPGLREALREARPLYVANLAIASSGATRATAQNLASGSLLNVPVAVGGVSQLMLGLLWTQVVSEPSRGLRDAAQRFADQAGLALEQARRRRAQTEVERLNETLQRMVSTDPLFRVGGTVSEVAEAICVAARDVFHAAAAALWVEHDGAIELLYRTPATPVLAPGLRLDLAEFPGFAADLAHGRPRFLDDVERDDPALWRAYARDAGSTAQLRLPLAGAGPSRSLIVLSWRSRAAPPSAEEQAIAARFGFQAAVALAEAERREARRAADRLHERLERSLLPTIELNDPRVRVSAFYRAGDERLSLGGDFYDCVDLPDGSVAAIMGDVSGHGPAAAALGASLRSAWRALALAGGRGPVELLDGLERVLVRERESPEMFVTAVVVVISPDRSSAAVSSAGHPPPLVLGGDPDIDEQLGAPPLGVVAGQAARPLARLPLASPASLVLYTDGLIEGRASRDASERFGVERVERLLAGVDPGAIDERQLARLVGAATTAHGSGLPDDVALLAVNLGRSGWSGTWPAEIESVSELRNEVERFVRAEGVDEATVHAVKLAVSEIASNAVVHGFVGRALPGRLTIEGHRAGGTLYVMVADDGSGLRPRSDSPGLGLGLAMIAQLADGVDIDTPAGGGTIVRLRFRVA